jgi:ApbE superfamily uncharacterized protein (UPF0280 family)
MSDAAMLFGYIGPMMAVAGAAWRMSARLAQVQIELKIIKAENAPAGLGHPQPAGTPVAPS